MEDVARKHQMNIARKTLGMSQVGASIMGGMSFAEAYHLVFKIDLAERIAYLQANYPAETLRQPFASGGINWELDKYGHRPCEFIIDSAYAD
jgi:hypothetical protein